MWSPYYRHFVGQLGLRNVREGFGVLPTYPARAALFSIPIDHCFISPSIAVTDVRTGPDVGSDHRPIIVDLRLPDETT